MLKILIVGVLLCNAGFCLAQSNPAPAAVMRALLNHGQVKKDTVMESDTSQKKEPRYYYFSLYTNFFVTPKVVLLSVLHQLQNSAEPMAYLISFLTTGQFNSIHADSARYLEFRPTITCSPGTLFRSVVSRRRLCISCQARFGYRNLQQH